MKLGIRIGLSFLLLAGWIFSGWAFPPEHAFGSTAAVPEDGAYFPGSAWRTSPPEAQGVDSEKLTDLLETIRKEQLPVRSFLLVRHGTLVAEAYFAPLTRESIVGNRSD